MSQRDLKLNQNTLLRLKLDLNYINVKLFNVLNLLNFIFLLLPVKITADDHYDSVQRQRR